MDARHLEMKLLKNVSVLSTVALLLQLVCLLDSPCAHAVVLTPRLIPAPRFEIARLRGGQDDTSVEEEEKDDLDMSDAGVVDGDDARVRLRLSLG